MLHVPPFMLTTGPVQAYPEVLGALGQPVLYDYHPAFQDFYEAVIGKLAKALRVSTPPVILQGEAILGIEAAAAGLIGRNDVVLNLVSGVYGKGFSPWATRYGREVIELEVDFDDAIDPASVEQAFKDRPDIGVVAVCHHDTPSGTLNPIREIGEIAARHGAFLIVDAVSSFAGMDVHPDDVHADIFITSPSKCLGSTPGLTLAAVSARAWAKIASNPNAPRASFLSLLDWKDAWRADNPFPVTPSIAEIYALDAALVRYAAEGPENVWARHAKTAGAARAGVKALGLELWPVREEIAAPTATVFRMPEGMSDVALRDLLRDRFGVLLSLGRKDTAGKVLRIGHMGYAAQPSFAVAAVTALGSALKLLGIQVPAEAGARAALALIEEQVCDLSSGF
ncbi:MAG: pyridoxamine--pyruvate transaminase [Phyllobacterium sp.]